MLKLNWIGKENTTINKDPILIKSTLLILLPIITPVITDKNELIRNNNFIFVYFLTLLKFKINENKSKVSIIPLEIIDVFNVKNEISKIKVTLLLNIVALGSFIKKKEI
jgi:hypothetical protein